MEETPDLFHAERMFESRQKLWLAWQGPIAHECRQFGVDPDELGSKLWEIFAYSMSRWTPSKGKNPLGYFKAILRLRLTSHVGKAKTRATVSFEAEVGNGLTLADTLAARDVFDDLNDRIDHGECDPSEGAFSAGWQPQRWEMRQGELELF